MNTDFNYNYLILGDVGYYLVGYQDVIKLNNVNYYIHYREGLGRVIGRLARATFSKTVNKYIPHPFSIITFPKVFKKNYSTDKPICLLAFSSFYYLLDTSYFDWFKKRHPGCKMVMYYQDKVRVHTPNMDFDRLKSVFDIVYSYDRQDCEQYGLEYYPTPYSRYTVPEDKTLPATDVFFCGQAKTRYNVILQAYESLMAEGLKCDFYLSKVPAGCPRLEGVHYNKWLSYTQYLQHLSRSRAILEVQQERADGFTPRLWESIMYDKHLITNNRAVFDSKFYNPLFHHPIDTALGSVSGLIKSQAIYSESEKDALSPIEFLHHIESQLA